MASGGFFSWAVTKLDALPSPVTVKDAPGAKGQ